MGKIIGAINMTMDGFCDHNAIEPDDELHQHYADLISSADAILYGRITYQLMGFWKTLIQQPSGDASMDNFAVVMDHIPKIVFSHTIQNVEWESAKLAEKNLQETVSMFKQQSGKPILVGSRSLIIQLMQLNLLDELQLCVHPVVAGSGLLLFENMRSRAVFDLVHTKTFKSGAVTLYYAKA